MGRHKLLSCILLNITLLLHFKMPDNLCCFFFFLKIETSHSPCSEEEFDEDTSLQEKDQVNYE